jgi:RNA polymerase sigma factor (sigma-70 family)
MKDWQPLREYLESGSEAAFTALVERHLNLVYSAALRRLGDPHAAQDVTQSVFCLLAQKARRLDPHTVLVGWLYQTASFKAAKYRRNEFRQHQHEREAAIMHTIDTTRKGLGNRSHPTWRKPLVA